MNKNPHESLIRDLEQLKISGVEDLIIRPGIENKTTPDLNDLKIKYSNCTKCGLSANRIKFVYGEGSSHARLVLIGEAPGADENRTGIPFVGRAGQLLTKMLKAIGLNRDQVYITNVVKCRPPNNRDPHKNEISACRQYLDEQLDLIKPEMLLLLGRVAAVSLLEMDLSLAKFRGKTYLYREILTLITYHPAALLRNSGYKRPAWEDFKKIRQEFNIH